MSEYLDRLKEIDLEIKKFRRIYRTTKNAILKEQTMKKMIVLHKEKNEIMEKHNL